MKTAKIFKSGNSQAVRLPKEFQFDVPEVEIFRQGNEVVLRKKPQNLARVFELLSDMSDDFMEAANNLPCRRGNSFDVCAGYGHLYLHCETWVCGYFHLVNPVYFKIFMGKKITILQSENIEADYHYWLQKTPEERTSAVEFLREQYYAIKGYKEIPLLTRVINIIDRSK